MEREEKQQSYKTA